MRFRCMLYVFYLDVAKVNLVLHMLQCYTCMLQVYVSNVSTVSNIHCKCMFQMFQLFHMYVASALSGCCNDYICRLHMLQSHDGC
jgi:hypothetical protein